MMSLHQANMTSVRGDGLNILLLIDHQNTLKTYIHGIKKNMPNANIITYMTYEEEFPPHPIHIIFFCDLWPRAYTQETLETIVNNFPEAKKIIVLNPKSPLPKKIMERLNPQEISSYFSDSYDLGILLFHLIKN